MKRVLKIASLGAIPITVVVVGLAINVLLAEPQAANKPVVVAVDPTVKCLADLAELHKQGLAKIAASSNPKKEELLALAVLLRPMTEEIWRADAMGEDGLDRCRRRLEIARFNVSNFK